MKNDSQKANAQGCPPKSIGGNRIVGTTYHEIERMTRPISCRSIINGCYFLERGIMASFINSDNGQIARIMSGQEKVAVVTGFGLTGMPHLGTKIIRDELAFMLSLGNKVYICVSSADAVVRAKSAIDAEQSESALAEFFSSLQLHPGCRFMRNDEIMQVVEKSPWNEKEAGAIFERIYETSYDSPKGKALACMAKSIIGIYCGQAPSTRCLVPLGIDEFDNASFVTATAQAIGLRPPIFTFNRIVPGYGTIKMGKSIPRQSLVMSGSPAEEYAKMAPYIGDRDHEIHEPCALCSAIFFSGHAIDITDRHARRNAHDNPETIIKEILG